MDEFPNSHMKLNNPTKIVVANVNGNNNIMPYVKIIEQPAPKALRFRYECEGRSAGSIPGISSHPDNKTYPTIQIVGYKGRAVVVVSCVTKDPPYRPHPHNLVGKDGCKKGICTTEINNDSMTAVFSNLGIQCVKKKDIEEALRVREEIRVDPFRTGFNHRSQANSIDLNSVRLCFQAFLDGSERGKFDVLTPIVSDPIYDKKAMSDLVICKLSNSSASVVGGTELILLCEKVAKDDIQIRFFEEVDGQTSWEAFADFSPAQVHKQVAISFRTPRYRSIEVENAVTVFIQLRRPSDGATSESLLFTFTPLHTDPAYMKRKRQKVTENVLSRHLQEFPDMRNLASSYHLLDKINRPMYPGPAPPCVSPSNVMPPCDSAAMPSGAGGTSHMSGGTILYPPNNNYQQPIVTGQHRSPSMVTSIDPSSGMFMIPDINQNDRMSNFMNLRQQNANNNNNMMDDNIVAMPVGNYNYDVNINPNMMNSIPLNENETVNMEFKQEIDVIPNIMDTDNQGCSIELSLSRLDSKDLVELSMLDGNLSENLSQCLTLSDSKPPSKQQTQESTSMTDSLTKLTNSTINDLCNLNRMYHDKN